LINFIIKKYLIVLGKLPLYDIYLSEDSIKEVKDMAVTAEVKGVKLVLKLEKGSQTVSNCSQVATDDALYLIGDAVANLQKEQVTSISKVIETTLIEA
jgi:hypothetical protein